MWIRLSGGREQRRDGEKESGRERGTGGVPAILRVKGGVAERGRERERDGRSERGRDGGVLTDCRKG